MSKKQNISIPPASADYSEMVNLLAVLSEASVQLNEIKVSADSSFVEIMDDIKTDYANLQETVTKTEAALKAIAVRHPEWFTDKKTVTTPYGSISFRTSTSIEIPNEEATIAKLELIAHRRYPGTTEADAKNRTEFLNTYLRTIQAVNKTALETEPNDFLDLIGAYRSEKENFSAKPASVDLGRAVAATQEKEAA